MQIDFETGMVYIAENNMDELVQELLHFPHAKHDDLAVTLANIITQLCRTPQKKEVKEEKYGWRTSGQVVNNKQHWLLA